MSRRAEILYRLNKNGIYLTQKFKEKDQRIAELEEQLKIFLKSNNDFLKQIMDLQSQLIVRKLQGEKDEK